jgi:hypothetical protein
MLASILNSQCILLVSLNVLTIKITIDFYKHSGAPERYEGNKQSLFLICFHAKISGY